MNNPARISGRAHFASFNLLSKPIRGSASSLTKQPRATQANAHCPVGMAAYTTEASGPTTIASAMLDSPPKVSPRYGALSQPKDFRQGPSQNPFFARGRCCSSSAMLRSRWALASVLRTRVASRAGLGSTVTFHSGRPRWLSRGPSEGENHDHESFRGLEHLGLVRAGSRRCPASTTEPGTTWTKSDHFCLGRTPN